MNNIDFNIYNNCLSNVSNSILNYYKVNTIHNSIKEIDDKLSEDNINHIILILLDGLGSSILDYHLKENDFLKKNKKKDIFSVIPTTTVAATTTVMSGMNPIEHGWIGWDVYFKDINKIVTLFTNKLKDSEEDAEKYNVAKTKLDYTNIFDLIGNKNKDVYIEKIFPFGENKYNSFKEAMERVKYICENHKKSFSYVYCNNPDEIMHKTGTRSTATHEVINELNDNIELLSKNINNSTIIVIADHGHIDSNPIYLTDYPQLLDTLRMDISIESRACAFFVKEDKKEEFKKIFNRNFSNDFILYDKDEIIRKKVFGDGKENKYFRDAIGDFVAFGISDKYFRSNRKCRQFLSQHAGITNEELLIPLIII